MIYTENSYTYTPLKTLLLVEDSELLRKLLSDFIKSMNMMVIEASCPREAVHTSSSYDGIIDLLVTDVGVGREQGWDCATAIVNNRPLCRVLFMSGAMDRSEWENHLNKPKGSYFIQKPFQLAELKAVLQNIFGQQRQWNAQTFSSKQGG
jgi:DNA-binding response OmpR family regulator